MCPTGDDTTHLRSDMTIVVQTPVRPVSGGRASLVVISGGEIGAEISLDPGQCPMELGRMTCAPLVQAASVSRKHARVEWSEEEGFSLGDMGSSNGTFVNGNPALHTVLKNGDRIVMGDVVLKFAVQDEVDAQFHQDVHRLIHYDQLTGLLTMETFRRRLDAMLRAGISSSPFCLAMTDLDGLKKVNDTHGHLAGRMVVREMGAMMRQSLRPQDLAGLYGGDEAIVLFPDTRLEEAQAVAEVLRKCIEERCFEHHGQNFGVSISQGLAEWPRHGKTAEALIAAADKALYAAKHDGRNCTRTADQC